MAKFLTIFNLFAGTASIVALFYSVLSETSINYYYFSPFIIPLCISIYILFVPNTKLEKNVRNKIRIYKSDKKPELIEQKGEFTTTKMNPVSIEFEPPFSEPPEFEIINHLGYNSDMPIVKNITRYQVVLQRKSYTHGKETHKYRWVARGNAVLFD